MATDKLLESVDPSVRHMADGAAAAVAVTGTFFVDNLNIFVLGLTVVWTAIRIWETETVKRMTGRWKEDD